MFSKMQKTQEKLSREELRDQQILSNRALTLYHRRYYNAMFIAATHGKTSKYANGLIDDALAICGDPFYTKSNMRYCQEARDFLAAFS